MAKNKIEKTDGLGAAEKAKIRSALRQVWQRSFARKKVIDRCRAFDDFSYCEACGQKVAKVFVDHIVPCGELDGGFIDRLFVSSDGLKGLCKKCHGQKTRAEARARKVKT